MAEYRKANSGLDRLMARGLCGIVLRFAFIDDQHRAATSE